MKKSLVLAAAAFALIGCNQVTENGSVSLSTKNNPIAAQVSVTSASCVQLIGGQTNPIGTVCNTVVGPNLLVTTSINAGVGLMDNVYIWAGQTWNSWPKKAANNLSPKHSSFPYLSGALGAATTYTHSIPLSDLGIDHETLCSPTTVYLIVHASGDGYTAFGAFGVNDLDVSGGGNWAYGYSLTLDGPPAPSIAFSPSSADFIVGDNVALSSGATGGPILSCEASPALPAGLTLDADCSISGVPTGPSSGTYTVTAVGQCGSSSSDITITVCEPAPAIAYSPSSVSIVLGETVSAPAISTGGPITSCSVSPALPDGLTLDAACGISGTPTDTSSGTYTVTAQGECFSGSASITIKVTNPPPQICYGNHESATGAGTTTGKNWFMVTTVNALGNASVNLMASQTKVAGTVTISGGVVTVTVASGWAFQAGSVIAIGGYATLPKGNLAPGQQPTQLATNGATSVTSGVVVAGKKYVFVHANVTPIVACPL